MRCAALLTACQEALSQPLDRSGHGRFLEVYPAAALRCWRISPRDNPDDPGSYKGASPQAQGRRERIVGSITEVTSPWLELSDKAIAECVKSDDCLDALICSLVARAAQLDLLQPLRECHAHIAGIEGWIRLPTPDSLSRLGTRA